MVKELGTLLLVAVNEEVVASVGSVLYVPEKASFDYLLNLPEGESIGKALNNAMSLLEDENTILITENEPEILTIL